ncbi:hypothetical protein [Streptomyces sp. VRA16 Mangrove soil]|uniref:hypothetical protein n=1 Tax=Streptomyces sp. VRA16 Mangrove soil TaxID=2817434 RepID=UPI001A9E619A|nr:hypothetical protein [Streptomyces sp. VRA16 Mangrove soil]MBO1331839.1 hypothetical protein [Streptomyces sp. VRA16 Mangrove soil]
MRAGWHTARTRRRLGLCASAVTLAMVAAVFGPGLLGGPPAARAAFVVSAVSALVSVAGLVLDVLRADADPVARPAGPDRRQAADALAEAVREQWSAEALVHALWDPEPLDVRWRPAERALADHPENIHPAGPIPGPHDAAGRTIGAAFAALPRRRLVVLGGPGSGKSVLALRFTLELLAVRAPGEPVPVIFPLAGWDPGRVGLRAWLVERLVADHRSLATPDPMHGTLAEALIAAHLVLPVLDGFDELPPALHGPAVRRINAELGAPDGLLLTSRGHAWRRAVREGDVLTAAEVVRLLPLDPGRARSYLERTAPPLPGGRTAWTPVLDRLRAEPAPPLAQALDTPLMVSLARAVYADRRRDPAELLDPIRFATPQAVEEHLLERFVPAAFGDDDVADGRWSGAQARRWLGWLARESRRRGTQGVAWWELQRAVPPAVRAVASAALALLAVWAVTSPSVLFDAHGSASESQDAASHAAQLAGHVLGLAFGLAFVLPRTARDAARPRPLLRRTGAALAASVVLGAGFAASNDLRFGQRTGDYSDSWFADLCSGFWYTTALALVFGVAGVARHPVPLGLPWSARTGNRVRVAGAGALLVLAGAGALAALDGAHALDSWQAIAATLLTLSGPPLLMAARRLPALHAPAAVAGSRGLGRRFARGLAEGLAACTLAGLVCGGVAGCVAGAVTVVRAEQPGTARAGDRYGPWYLDERRTGDGPVRTAVSVTPVEGRLLAPRDGGPPLAYPEGVTPPECDLWIPGDGDCTPFVSTRTAFRSSHGTVSLTLRASGRDVPVYAANLRRDLPAPVRAWLTRDSAWPAFRGCLAGFAGIGLVVGLIGGFTRAVYAALTTPSDVLRAPGPAPLLRADRTAAFARAGVVAVLTAGVCFPVALVLGSRSGFGQAVNQLWIPLAAAPLVLGAWGRLLVARAWLAVTGRMPWRLMAFLDEAHRRGVLRQSGGRYEFRHLRLRRRLAAFTDTDDPAATAPPVRT